MITPRNKHAHSIGVENGWERNIQHSQPRA
jgi:hypothetical protein